jgi:hypothetical protein
MRPVVLEAVAWRARRLLLTGCLALGVLGLRAAGAQAATPASLAGETFTSQHVNGSTLTGVCDGRGGSFSFSLSGTAAGPFPGTFTESGSFSAPRNGFTSNFSSTFTITSTVGTVTGTKHLVGTNSQAVCDSEGFVRTSNLTTLYTATINGAQRNTGAATVSIAGLVGGSPIFTENFGSTGIVQERCKHGGWKSFGILFKNQGDCVSFVATGGKNPPSGP